MDSSKLIRNLVADSGDSMREISRRIGQSDTYVASIVGRGSTPRADTLARIANACGFRIVATNGTNEYELTAPISEIVVQGVGVASVYIKPDPVNPDSAIVITAPGIDPNDVTSPD